MCVVLAASVRIAHVRVQGARAYRARPCLHVCVFFSVIFGKYYDYFSKRNMCWVSKPRTVSNFIISKYHCNIIKIPRHYSWPKWK